MASSSLRASPFTAARAWLGRAEAPTWAVLAAIYAGWGLLTWFHASLPWWVLAPAGGWMVAWHGSLQHEALHGHPTRIEWLNTLLAAAPLGIWMPYHIYRESHLVHHQTKLLTDPANDPESYYASRETWDRFGWPRRALLTMNNTLAGRMVVGPWIAALSFWRRETTALLSGDYRHASAWALHLALCAAVLTWVSVVCAMPIYLYVLLFVWPGLSLILVRSYLEHRPAAEQDRRTVIVEAGWPMSLLFLNNNLHVAHHDRPAVPWYELPAIYRAGRDRILERNGNYRFAGGYAEIARKFAFRPKDIPVHTG